MIEPGPCIWRARGFEPEQAADGALRAQGRRVPDANRGELAIRAGQADDPDLAGLRFHQGHVHAIGLAPEAEQAHAPFRQ
jgi:hypothetical protein